MKIAIEVTPFTKHTAGIYRYGVNLVQALQRVEPSLEIAPISTSLMIGVAPTHPATFAGLFGRTTIPSLYQFTGRGGKIRGTLVRSPHFFQRAYQLHRRALKEAGKKRSTAYTRWLKLKREFHRLISVIIDALRNLPYQEITLRHADADTVVLHSLYNALPEEFGRYRPKLTCQTVHDVIPLLFKHSYHVSFEPIIESARRADLLIVISEATKQDLLGLEGFHAENIEVIPLAADQAFRPSSCEEVGAVRSKAGIPDGIPYFLSVSTVEPRKNFAFLLKAFRTLIHTPGAPPCRLVLTGAAGWGNTMVEISPLLEELKEHVHYTGYVSDQELAALYTGTETLLFPSLYEGFGLPALEAMACGAHVISSNSSSLPEVIGDAGVLLSPHDEQAWVEAMTHALQRTDEKKRRDTAAAIARSQLFSWEKNARQTLDAYARALKRKESAAAGN